MKKTAAESPEILNTSNHLPCREKPCVCNDIKAICSCCGVVNGMPYLGGDIKASEDEIKSAKKTMGYRYKHLSEKTRDISTRKELERALEESGVAPVERATAEDSIQSIRRKRAPSKKLQYFQKKGMKPLPRAAPRYGHGNRKNVYADPKDKPW